MNDTLMFRLTLTTYTWKLSSNLKDIKDIIYMLILILEPTMCIAKWHALQEELWKLFKIKINAIIASQHAITLDYAIENLKILISGNEFIVSTIYQCDTQSSYILIGNNLMQKYIPLSSKGLYFIL